MGSFQNFFQKTNMMLKTTNTYEEVHAQLKGSVIAGDMHGIMVAPGDPVMLEDKRYIIKELFEEHDEVRIGLEDGDNILWVCENDIELVLS